ncbi:unnamed protein product [Cuscuta europaea]|uniref:Uncharacterized protein n=1 Tax=Cuscuta europaea TaxID=41803 RepID=A0A9P0YQV9_CUSEU|nr:unnamed protein product [Cuscuta europaea]
MVMDHQKIWVVLAALSLAISAADLSSATKFPVVDLVNQYDQNNVTLLCKAVKQTILQGQIFSFEAKEINDPDAYGCGCYDSQEGKLIIDAYDLKRDKQNQLIHWKFTSVGAYLSYDNIHWKLDAQWESD